jgi:hypothetical protein
MKENSMNNPMTNSKKTQFSTQQPKAAPISSPQQIQDIPSRKSVASATPAHSVVARRAYELYIEMGYPQGQSEHIWQQAEREIRDRELAAFLIR